jgi:glycosyltransferase A (GT-A) superfamily protein (DUF2064 family)
LKNTFSKETAILIFANSAIAETRRKKTLANLNLFHALTERTLQTAKTSGLPYFHFTEKEQQGTSFGARFSNAIQAIYDKGYKNVITIGNDSPQLKASHIIEAEKQLQLGKTVLGPASDGGFYLMGLHCSNFDPNLFLRLPWQRFGLFNKISQLFESYDSHVHRLPVLHDIDSEKDIKTLLNFSKTISITILKILGSLLKRSTRIVSKNVQILQYYFHSLHFNKGSPVLMRFS